MNIKAAATGSPVLLFLLIVPLLLIIVCAVGCTDGSITLQYNDPVLSTNITMGTFENNEDLRRYILNQYAENVLPDYSYGTERMTDEATFAGNAESLAANGSAPKSDEYSQTNVQEKGVDEADVVKNDGRFIYISAEKSVRVVDTLFPAKMEEISVIPTAGRVNALYLHNDLLLILYTPDNGEGDYWIHADRTVESGLGFCYWLPVNTKIGVMVMDVSEPATPRWLAEYVIDGNLISSRRIGDNLYLVQQFLPELPPFDYYYNGNARTREAIIEANHEKLSRMELKELVPFYTTIGPDGRESEPVQLISPDDFFSPSRTCGGSVVSVAVIDLADLSEPISAGGVIADAHTVYASFDSLYLASTRWNDNAYREGTFSDVYHTILFKFSLTEAGVLFAGVGGVNGKILNQFSLGEYEGVLRIATTSGGTWLGDGHTGNNLFCLKEEEDKKLIVIGAVEGLAPGETIYAARFLGPRGYLVTFVQVDPLFTLDLSDPYTPKVVGELKVPGFSNYLHPLADDYLLAIGRDVAVHQGVPLNRGLQLSIFDVHDFENPTLVHQEIIGDQGTGSEAQYNHKAFTFWETNGLLAIPVDLYETAPPETPDSWGSYRYSGLFVYDVSPEEGFHRLGVIRTNNDSQHYFTPWTRGLFIGDHVFAVNPQAVHAAEYDAIPVTTGTLTLQP